MNVPPPAPSIPDIPAREPMVRDAGTATIPAFANTLAHEQGRLEASTRKGKQTDDSAPPRPGEQDAQRPLTPEETLAMLAAGSTLALMHTAGGAQTPTRADGAQATQEPISDTARTAALATSLHEGKASPDAPDDDSVLAAARQPGTAALTLQTDVGLTQNPAHAAADANHKPAPSHPGRTDDRSVHRKDARTEPAPLRLLQPQVADPQAAASRDAQADIARASNGTVSQARMPASQISIQPGRAATETITAAAADMPLRPAPQGVETTTPTFAGVLLQGMAAASQTSTGAAATSAAPAFVPTALGDPAWPADFGRQFLSLAQGATGQIQRAELHLNPPDLGPVRIVLHLQDSVTQALFISPHAPVRHAIENALPQLQQQLAQAGLSLGQADVSDQQPGQQQAFPQPQPDGGGKNGAPAFSLAGDTQSRVIADDPQALVVRSLRNANTLVDTFA